MAALPTVSTVEAGAGWAVSDWDLDLRGAGYSGRVNRSRVCLPIAFRANLERAMQLDLFSDWLAGRNAMDAALAGSPSDSSQLDLFGNRALRMNTALSALYEMDFETAYRDLSTLAAQYPRDSGIREALDLASRLRRALQIACAANPDPLSALASLERDLPPHLEAGWHRRIAAEAERLLGEGSVVAGLPIGHHWLAIGEISRAERSLRATLAGSPENARARGLLADALFVQGEAARARREYARAFSEAPRAVDLQRLLDPEVRVLPDIARLELEVDGDGVDWVAALGTVRGIFALPDLLLPGFAEPKLQRESEPGLLFLAALRAERRSRSLDERVEARRSMKRLCPLLFAEYFRQG